MKKHACIYTTWFTLSFCFASMLVLNGCENPDVTQVGFILVRTDDASSNTTRAQGLDRDRVAWAQCQILDSAATEIAGGMVRLDNNTGPGEQEVSLKDVPIGENRFARIRGLDDNKEVWECGATGPFDLEKGQRLMVTIIIHRARANDPQCEQLCSSHTDCPADSYCPSLCARQVNAPECTESLCDVDFVGRSCSTNEDCGPLSCLFEEAGLPGGYCSAACLNDLSCMGRALCIDFLGAKSCFKACSTDDDCRTSEGYYCSKDTPGREVCLPRA